MERMTHIPTPAVIICDRGVLDCCIVHSMEPVGGTCWTYKHPGMKS